MKIVLIKYLIKFQNGQTTKGHELLQLRNDYRETREKLNNREEEIIDLRRSQTEKDNEIEKLKNQIKRLSLQSTTDVKLMMDTINNTNTPAIIQNDLNNFNSIHSTFTNFNIKDSPLYNSLVSEGNDNNNRENDIDDFNKETDEDIEVRSINSNLINHNCKEVEKLKDELELRKRDFEKEKVVWAQEKEKVLKYQRQLQMNYVQMYRKTRTLENEIENLRIEMDMKGVTLTLVKNNAELNQTIEL